MSGFSSASSVEPLIVGVNHRTGGLTLRDRLFVEDGQVAAFLADIDPAAVPEALVMSTCDRVEVFAVTPHAEAAVARIAEALGRHAKIDEADLRQGLFDLRGEDAVRHLFRVASSLDSVVVGEPQVLGQLKACHRLARDAGRVAGGLETLLQAAYVVAKRVRSETAIGERPVSIAAVAVGLARDVHGDLARARTLVLGVGDMGEVIATELQRAGMGATDVADFGGRTAMPLADRLAARHITEDRLVAALAEADVIVTSIGGRGRPLTADMVQAALRVRKFKPQFIIDAGLPSDVEAAVDRIDDAFLYDLADLERLATEGRANRAFEAEAAERILEQELAVFAQSGRERDAVPALNALRGHAERLREQALVDAGGDAAKATHLLISRLLHAPSTKLRALAERGDDAAALERMIMDLFDIQSDRENDR